MNALAELTEIMGRLDIPVETGVFSDAAPALYCVLTPLYEESAVQGDGEELLTRQEVRISLYSQEEYTSAKKKIVAAVKANGFTVTSRFYIGFDDETAYHQFEIDVAKDYPD